MRVAVICEESGVVRDAFLRAGHDAISVDLLPSRSSYGPHHQGDAIAWLERHWADLDLAIMHPECTYFTRAGERWLHHPTDDDRPGKLKGAPRWAAFRRAVEFWHALHAFPIPRLAVENPRPCKPARAEIGDSTQVIHPYQFGHLKTKETHLWLRNLPPLVPTSDLKAETMALPPKERSSIWYESPGPNRARNRSVTFQGIADAMAAQWGAL